MKIFLKAQAASLFASTVDFLTTLVSVQVLGAWYLTGSVTGTIAGGWVNFSVGRRWVFKSGSQNIHKQAIKYLLVWAGNLLLVTIGVFLLTHVAKFNYIFSKILVSLLVGSTYNYLMQKRFVFLSLHENTI
jgi:putative flippase GtrA